VTTGESSARDGEADGVCSVQSDGSWVAWVRAGTFAVSTVLPPGTASSHPTRLLCVYYSSYYRVLLYLYRPYFWSSVADVLTQISVLYPVS
jgi:hypothetical protein